MIPHPYFDTHAHYHDGRFAETEFADTDQLLDSLFSDCLCGLTDIGTDVETSRQALALAERYPAVYAAVGIYPGSCPADSSPESVHSVTEEFRAMLSRPKAVAIGEIGLDYHYEDSPSRETQLLWFESQMQLAEETGYPVCIHTRDALEDTLAVLRNFPRVHGILHCFSGSAETAAELVKMGYYISFSGVLTYKNANRVKRAAAAVPDDRVVVETDCPYLPPEPHRGQVNHSGYLVHTLSVLAGIRGISPDEAADLTTRNACRVYRLQEN